MSTDDKIKEKSRKYVWYKRFTEILEAIDSGNVEKSMKVVFRYLDYGSFKSSTQAGYARDALNQLLEDYTLERDLNEVQASGSTWNQ